MKHNAVTTDDNGNIYVTGAYEYGSDINLGNGIILPNNSGQTTAYIIKYNQSGVPQQAVTFYADNVINADGIVLDSNNNIYISGQYDSSVNVILSPTLFLPPTTEISSYLIKYNSLMIAQKETEILFSSRYGLVPRDLTSNPLAIDTNDNLYITGYYNINTPSGIQLDNGFVLPDTQGNDNTFMVKYDSINLESQAATTINLSNQLDTEFGYDVRVDSNNNVYLTGTYYSDAVVPLPGGTVSLPIATDNTSFLIKYVPNGTSYNAVWVKTIPAITSNGISVGIDSNGNIYNALYYESGNEIDLGNGYKLPQNYDTPSNVCYGFALIKYDTNGNIQFAKTIATLSVTPSIITEVPTSVFVNENNVYVGIYCNTDKETVLENNTIIPNTNNNRAFGFITFDAVSGDTKWANFGVTNSASIAVQTNDICSTSNNSFVYIVGTYDQADSIPVSEPVDLGNSVTLPSTNSQNYSFIIQYN
jgi:hypothetical protein